MGLGLGVTAEFPREGVSCARQILDAVAQAIKEKAQNAGSPKLTTLCNMWMQLEEGLNFGKSITLPQERYPSKGFYDAFSVKQTTCLNSRMRCGLLPRKPKMALGWPQRSAR